MSGALYIAYCRKCSKHTDHYVASRACCGCGEYES